MTETDDVLWAARLTPHRSLSRRGFHIMMAVLVLLNSSAGLYFFLAGAWPVVGFMGLDVGLIWFAFNRNYKAAQCAEIIHVTPYEVIVETSAVNRPSRQQRFVRRWVRLELQEDEARELIGPLYLWFKGKRTELGGFLSPVERKAFARALGRAISQS